MNMAQKALKKLDDVYTEKVKQFVDTEIQLNNLVHKRNGIQQAQKLMDLKPVEKAAPKPSQ